MRYKWNSSKCVILDSSTDPITYILYNQPLPRETTFTYLGVPFKPSGHLSLEELIQRNTRKTLATMNILSSVGVNPSGFSKLLCTRFYAHIVRPQLEYGLAINHFTVSQLHALEEVQNNCNKKIYGARDKASTKIMLHMSRLLSCQNESRFLLQNLEIRQRCRNSKLLSSCRRSTSLDPILWLPMSKSECSRCIRWRLGWLPGGQTSVMSQAPNATAI
ncbi:uncharacterized protein RHIMIDRAFT_233497 [Rhizopus microsporus ATCC 52813]|uniref:Uncharacterized protein n=1 Tax=Rhizopus microsporus ATCC 52813 TaxID=1340429 RepID=A0A2G4T4F6_RHIZD|nr:uncharacterized protein RHIMIDRAFT_233497 [Rhizopus microsporus ATCC 52813]PHZ15890.1 hypothetical protein RHIMIDRAFT_233497 [Rhizopus microsporus ATCC 52813]